MKLLENIFHTVSMIFEQFNRKARKASTFVAGVLFIAGLSLTPLCFAPAAAEAPFGAAGADAFKLSDEEIKALGLNENEAAELRQFFDALNNLSPEQKKELEDLGRQTEEKMRQKKMDPTNFDDLMKFMEEEGMAAPAPQKSAPAPVQQKRELEEPRVEKPIIVPVTSPTDTLSMLNESLKHIASLRQKALTREVLAKRLDALRPELSQLAYSLNSLKSPDLIMLLSTREFFTLHNALENLHRALVTYEPSIIARKSRLFDEDDPYSILSISYAATPEDIETAYQSLEEAKNPKAIETALKEQGMDADAIKKQLKQATRAFNVIKSAYTQLKDPKKRAAIDKKLQKRIEKEERNEQVSGRAFNRLYDSLSQSLTTGLLPGIQQLFEKYKPQEAAQARAQGELERKAFERSKQIVRVPQMVVRDLGQPDPYAGFYQKMAQESYQRPYIGRPGGFSAQTQGTPSNGGPAKKEEKPAGGGGKDGKKGGKPEGGKEDKNGKDKGSKDKSDQDKEKKKDNGKPESDKEKYEKYAAIRQIEDSSSFIEKVLKARDAEAEEAAAGISEDEPTEGFRSIQLRKPTLQSISISLQEHLTGRRAGGFRGGGITGRLEPADAPAAAIDLAQELKLEQLEQPLKTLAMNVRGKKVDPDLKKEWEKRVVKPYGALIQGIHDQLYAQTLGKPVKDSTTERAFNLNVVQHDIWAKEKPKVAFAAEGTINLGALRNRLFAIGEYYKTINQSLGVNPANIKS